VKVFSAGLVGDGLAAISWDPVSLVQVDRSGSYSTGKGALDPVFVEGLGLQNWVVNTSDGLWLVDTFSGSIVWKAHASDLSERYQLPVWRMNGVPIGCPPVRTAIGLLSSKHRSRALRLRRTERSTSLTAPWAGSAW
jgi:hypothetical protein